MSSERPANANNVHPVLAMFQNAIDPADPLDHADRFLANAVSGDVPQVGR